jgi:hypothetical protein
LRAWRNALARLCACLASIVLFAGAGFAADQGQNFLLVVKQLAGSGKLTDPDDVARVLGTTLTSFSDDVSSLNPGPCNQIKSQEIHIFRAASDFWYKPNFDGTQRLMMPGPNGQPVESPTFTYQISKTISCAGWHAIGSTNSAEITFNYLPGFACITADGLRKALPGIEWAQGTDFSDSYHYRGYAAEDSGTIASFSMGAALQCSLGVNIRQDMRYGSRAQRAYAKMRACERAELEASEADPAKKPELEHCRAFYSLDERD